MTRNASTGLGDASLKKKKIHGYVTLTGSDLHLSETMLPDSDKWGGSILAVVHENDPWLC